MNNAISQLQFGLSLDKTMTDAMNPYLDSHQDRCILEELAANQRSGPIVYFIMDLKNLKYRTLRPSFYGTLIKYFVF